MTPTPYGGVGPAPADDSEWAADTLDQYWAATDNAADLHAAGTHLLDLVAAVDHFARGLRHDFTVWDALDEALHWWLAEHTDPSPGRDTASDVLADQDSGADGRDPLLAHMTRVLDLVADDPATTLADTLQQALRRWTITTADYFNAGYHWPHPTLRRPFPPPLTHPGQK